MEFMCETLTFVMALGDSWRKSLLHFPTHNFSVIYIVDYTLEGIIKYPREGMIRKKSALQVLIEIIY